MSKEYRIQIGNSRAYIKLAIYKTVQSMRQRISKDGEKDYSNTMGMFEPSTYYENEMGETFYQEYIGTIYLNEDQLGSGVVAHECLHAAMACERSYNRFGMKYDVLTCNDDEERLCYLLTDIIKHVYNLIYDNEHAIPGNTG